MWMNRNHVREYEAITSQDIATLNELLELSIVDVFTVIDEWLNKHDMGLEITLLSIEGEEVGH